MRKILLLLVATYVGASTWYEDMYRVYKRTPLGDSIDIASMKLLNKIYEQSSDKVVVSSPLGVLILLSLYASGSEENIREEIMQLLDATDYKMLSDSYCQLVERFSTIDPNYLILANKVFVSDKYSLDERFVNESRVYKSEMDSINFEDTKNAVDTINEWSSKKTKRMINQPMSQSDIDTDTVVALLNVIFFKGHWHVPFNASETKEQDFNVNRYTVVKKPMMHLEQSLYYYEDKDMGAKMVELPYKESKFRMIVVLPDEVDGLPQVLKKVSEKGLLEIIFQMYPPGVNVDLYMPKFEIKTKTNFNDILTKVGVSSIFKDASMGIVKERSVTVSKVLQEVFIKLDEEGATAGAFTGMVLEFRSDPPPRLPSIPFKVDRPFLYAILHDDVIVFTGTYTCPYNDVKLDVVKFFLNGY